MTQSRTLIIVLVTLIIGFGGGFVLRPIIIPASPTAAVAVSPPAVPAAPRGTQYFAAHPDEARQIVAQCAEGSVRGNECASADAAIIAAEGRDRFKRFMGN